MLMNTKLSLFLTRYRIILMIFAAFICTAFMQANSAFMSLDHQRQTAFFVLLFFAYFTLCFFLLKYKKLSTEDKVFLIILGGVILRSFYVVFTGLGDRQHDEGYFTGLSDNRINPGHLGYIEYLCKFGHLPDFSPYELFSYYHPPLHHIIACLFIDLQLLLGVTEALAFENIQSLTLLYSSLCLPVAYGILKKIKCSDTCMLLGISLITFHPGMIYMAGSTNNDMLCTLLTFLCFYFALQWMENKSFRNLMLIAITLGFGMITKLNCAVMAFPLAAVFLLHFISECKNRNALKTIRDYAVFLIVTAGIGLSWVIRNLVFYKTNPGVPVLTESSIQYIGKSSFWDIFGIPAHYGIDYPFHTLNGGQICNSWLILFRTSLFDEIRPDLSDVLLISCRIALILAVLLGTAFFFITIAMQIREIRNGDRELGIFLLAGYTAVVVTFIAFIIKYPYTCSANYRYVVVGLLFTAISLLQLCDKPRIHSTAHRIFAAIIHYGIFSLLAILVPILLVWNQW